MTALTIAMMSPAIAEMRELMAEPMVENTAPLVCVFVSASIGDSTQGRAYHDSEYYGG